MGEYTFYLDDGSGGRDMVTARFTFLFSRDSEGGCAWCIALRGGKRRGLQGLL